MPVDQTNGVNAASALSPVLPPSATNPPAGTANVATDLFTRDGTHASAPVSPGGGLTIIGGAPDRLAAAEAAFTAARDRYLEIRSRWRGSGLSYYDPTLPIDVPDEVRRGCDALLGAAAELCRARGIAVELDRRVGTLTILADPGTPLGQYAATLGSYGERAVFNPTMLYAQNAFGHHDMANRIVFISVAAAEAGNPGVTEGHELIHARLRHRFNAEERYHLLNGWLTPAPATNLFGPNRSYTGGFSLEELATAAHDILADSGRERLRTSVAALDDPSHPQHAAAMGEARRTIAALERYLTQLNRPSLPAAVEQACDRFLAEIERWGSPSWCRAASDYYDDFTRIDPATGRYPKRQVLRQGDAGAELHAELTHYPLFDKQRQVIGALLVDRARNLRLEVPILDPTAVARVTDDGAPVDGVALAELVRRFLPARLRAQKAFAAAQREAYTALVAAVAALRQRLDDGAPAGETIAPLDAALERFARLDCDADDHEPRDP